MHDHLDRIMHGYGSGKIRCIRSVQQQQIDVARICLFYVCFMSVFYLCSVCAIRYKTIVLGSSLTYSIARHFQSSSSIALVAVAACNTDW